MNTTLVKSPLAALTLVSTFSLQPLALLAQGSLTPPGAPGPTMRTLAQIEPRTPISSAPFTITDAGAYYLTTNLTVSTGDAITIAASGVALDLCGFTISSSAPSATGYGIRLNAGLRNLAIVNGFIQGGVTNNAGIYSGPGFYYGISFSSQQAPMNTRVSGVSVSGCRYYGIYLSTGESTVVESCTVRTVGSYGIMASAINNSVAADCGGSAIYGDHVAGSRGQCTGSQHGVYAGTALNSYGSSSGSFGIWASSAQNCYGSSTSDAGIAAHTAHNCYGVSDAGIGLEAESVQNCYGVSDHYFGLSAYTAQNCYGISTSYIGLSSSAAQSCYGRSTSGTTGLQADTASFCVGYRPGGRAIEATIATGCYAKSGTNKITYKYNMP